MALTRAETDRAVARLVVSRGLVAREQVERCLDSLKRAGGEKPLVELLREQGFISRGEAQKITEEVARQESASATPPTSTRVATLRDADLAMEQRPRSRGTPAVSGARLSGGTPVVSGGSAAISSHLRPGAGEASENENDLALAKVAIERGLVTLDGVRDAIEAQQDLAALGRPIPLGQLMIRRRAIDVETFVDLAREVRARSVRCATCKTLSLMPRAEDLPPGFSEGRCAKCGGSLPLRKPGAPATEQAAATGAGGHAAQLPAPSPSLRILKTMTQTAPPSTPAPAPGKPPPERDCVPLPSTPAFGQPFVVEPDPGEEPQRDAGAPTEGVGLPPGSIDLPELEPSGSGPSPVAPPLVPSLVTPPDRPSSKPTAGKKDGAFAGKKFGKYDVVDEIARGGMGIVYRAKDPTLGRIVALKVLKDGVHATEKQVRRFKRETEAVAKLHHPNIVAVHDVGCEDGHHYFTMDYVEGEPLDGTIRRGPIDPPRALIIAEQVARAIHHAHEQGVIHRDLKPANVLLDKHGVPKITDFGLAKNIDHLSAMTKTGAAVGTPFYMPPEQARGDAKKVDRRVDVYAIGVILFEMLTGELPFDGETTLEVYHKILQEDSPRPSGLDPRIDGDTDIIVAKAMSKERDDRYGSALALADDIRRRLDGQRVLARPPGAMKLAARRARRAGPLIAAGIAGLLVIGVAVGVASYLRGQHDKEIADNDAKKELDHLYETGRVQVAAATRLKAKALAAIADGHAEEARASIDAAEKAIDGSDAWLADLHYREKNEARARAFVKEFAATEARPLLRDLSLLRARALAVSGDPASDEAAERAFERAIALDPTSFEARLEEARFLVSRERLDQAVDQLGRALETRPGDPEALLERARAYEAMRMFSRAIEEYRLLESREREAAQRLRPRPATPEGSARLAAAVLGGASCLAALGRPQDALARLREIAEDDPARFPSLCMAVNVRLALGDVKGAWDDAAAAVKLAPQRAEGYLARARVELALGDNEKAGKDVADALERDPRSGAARLLRALALDRRGDAKGALEGYAALAADAAAPREARATAKVRLGDVARDAGETEKAIASYGEAIALEPRLAAAFVARARTRARAAISLEDAQKDVARARELGADPSALSELEGMLALFGRRDPGAAAGAFERALEAAAGGYFPEAAALLGASRAQIDDTVGAREAYTRALDQEARAASSDLLDIFTETPGKKRAGSDDPARVPSLLPLVDPALASLRPSFEATLFFRLGCAARDDAASNPARAEDAIRALDRASRLSPELARAHYERARLRRAQGALEQAWRDASAAVRANPFFTDALLLRSGLLLDMVEAKTVPAGIGDATAAARADLERALVLEPNRVDGQLGLGRAALYGKRYDAAKAALDAAIELSMRGAADDEPATLVALRADAYALRAQVDEARGQADLSRADMARAQELRDRKRELAMIAYSQGQALQKDSRIREAIDRYTAAIEADRTLAAAWYERGNCRVLLYEPVSAALDVSRALELDGRYADSAFDQAIGQVRSLDVKPLFDQIAEVLKTSPEDVPALFLRALYNTIRCYVGEAAPGDDELARADLDRVVRLSPRFAFALTCRAWLEQRKGEIAAAEQDARLAEGLDLKCAMAPYVSAIIAARKGDAGAAAAALERAIGRGFRSSDRIGEEKIFTTIAGDARWQAAVKKLGGGG